MSVKERIGSAPVVTFDAKVVLNPGDPLPSARAFLDAHYTQADVRTLHHHAGVFYAWDGRCSLGLNKAVREKAEDLAESVKLQGKLNRFTDKLSQGEKQRVAIARALLPNPNIVLADEPTGNLDPKSKGEVLDCIFENISLRGATLLMATHSHEDLGRFDRVIDFEEFFSEVPA